MIEVVRNFSRRAAVRIAAGASIVSEAFFRSYQERISQTNEVRHGFPTPEKNSMKYPNLTRLVGLLVVLTIGASSAQGTDEPTGSLVIQAIQGTHDGPVIGIADVEVDLIHQGTVSKTITTQLDEYGIVLIEDIPLGVTVVPVVHISFQGVTYQKTGTIMDQIRPQQTVKVTCYETTNDTPAWSIVIRQVMLSYAPQGVKITEIVVIKNPTKMTWLGIKNPPEKPTTLSLKLPEGAEQIKLEGGFQDWSEASFADGTLTSHQPLKPHMTEINFSYFIKIKDSTLDLSVFAPASIEQMVIMLPEEMHTLQLTGLKLGGTQRIADTQVRFYTASDLSKGDAVGLSLSMLSNVHMPLARPESKPTHSSPPERSLPSIVTVVGGILILVAAGLFITNRRAKSANENPSRKTGHDS